ncbi:MAG TPA: hypothetical protein VHE55_16625 [Fimbriimonadaceae bacterium]|nr:hypothetical protein [Fimbriimonadaceae bacterium]
MKLVAKERGERITSSIGFVTSNGWRVPRVNWTWSGEPEKEAAARNPAEASAASIRERASDAMPGDEDVFRIDSRHMGEGLARGKDVVYLVVKQAKCSRLAVFPS